MVMKTIDVNRIRQQDSFQHACRIQKKYGILDDILAWCKTGLTAEWRWQLVEGSTDKRPGRYIFYFDSDRDFFAFVLHWT